MSLSDWSFDESVKELDFNGVYKYSIKSGLELISNELGMPNGLALSNDERYTEAMEAMVCPKSLSFYYLQWSCI